MQSAGAWALNVVSGPDIGAVLRLRAGGLYSLGTGSEAHLQLRAPAGRAPIDKVHGFLVLAGEGVRYADASSQCIGGVRVLRANFDGAGSGSADALLCARCAEAGGACASAVSSTLLLAGDRLALGETELLVVHSAAPELPPPLVVNGDLWESVAVGALTSVASARGARGGGGGGGGGSARPSTAAGGVSSPDAREVLAHAFTRLAIEQGRGLRGGDWREGGAAGGDGGGGGGGSPTHRVTSPPTAAAPTIVRRRSGFFGASGV